MVGHALWFEKCPNQFHEVDGQFFHTLTNYFMVLYMDDIVTYPSTPRPGYATFNPTLGLLSLIDTSLKLIRTHKIKGFNNMRNNNQQACIF
jgi:hypothetical protein